VPQRFINVQMFRKPSQADLAKAKGDGHERPPAHPLGHFQVPYTTVDKTRVAAREEAGRRLKVAPSRLIASFQPMGVVRGEEQHGVVVYAPALDDKGTA
jgi:hypothetical protein